MRRSVAILALLVSLLGAANAHAATSGPRLPSLFPSRLLGAVGEPVAPPQQFRSGFSIDADSGYEVKVATSGSAVILEVLRRRHGMRTETVYLARGVALPERLQATFGRFGKISMHFRQSHGTERKQVVCRDGRRFDMRRGVFVGSLEFKGEGGYVAVAPRRAKGTILTPAGGCPRHRRLRRGFDLFSAPPTTMVAVSRQGVDLTGFLTAELGGRTSYLAVHEETRGRLGIIRFAVLRGGRPLHVNEAATAATVAPPAPFHGSGHYRAAPDGTTAWTGSLSIDFPGAPRYPLAGPPFEAFLEAPF
ncbi:MAG TPA: hypothetical protein VGW80_10255 [Solirubrobacterales bacterium]|jgi:hypothetical protein|nr:hypothetical protein [Solirubrobacterales bacterium]